jgi:acyl-coenzyme A thioesterase 13
MSHQPSQPIPVPPVGYKRLHASAYLELIGPCYYAKDSNGVLSVGVYIQEKHVNAVGIGHGGLLVTLADATLGLAIYEVHPSSGPMVTASLSTEFLEPARLGDWVEVHVDLERIGKRISYANCFLHVGERRILRASGVFVSTPPQPVSRRLLSNDAPVPQA